MGSDAPRTREPTIPAGLAAEIARLLDRVPIDFGGGCSILKAETIAECLLGGGPALAVDIGVYRGRSLLPMAATFRWLGRGMAVGVDPYSAQAAEQTDEHQSGRSLVDWAREQDWEGLYNSVVKFLDEENLGSVARIYRMRSAEAAAHFEKGSIGLVHIDGNHDRQIVFTDLALYRPLVEPSGFIVLDDVSWASVYPVYVSLCDSAVLVAEAHSPGDDFAVFRIES